MKELRVIISGGGTGGHIFPAISIANALKEIQPNAKILFVGALGRMEMQRVPAAGYEIKGLPIRGLLRPLWKPGNIGVLWDFMKSKRMVKRIIREFQPQVAVGVGGYASSATLNAAYELGIPCLIQEQNSFAGLTNKTLAKKAQKICVAYEGMERFFPKERILMTGNPIRQDLQNPNLVRETCIETFGLEPQLPTILVIGGSLGARTINQSILNNLKEIKEAPIQIIWQTGSYYSKDIQEALKQQGKPANLYVTDFISRMDQAYRAADLVVSRAGRERRKRERPDRFCGGIFIGSVFGRDTGQRIPRGQHIFGGQPGQKRGSELYECPDPVQKREYIEETGPERLWHGLQGLSTGHCRGSDKTK